MEGPTLTPPALWLTLCCTGRMCAEKPAATPESTTAEPGEALSAGRWVMGCCRVRGQGEGAVMVRSGACTVVSEHAEHVPQASCGVLGWRAEPLVSEDCPEACQHII